MQSVWLASALLAVGCCSAARAQAPLIVDLSEALLRGLAEGAGEQAGKEIYNRMKEVPQPPTVSPQDSTPSGDVANPRVPDTNVEDNAPPTVPIEPPVPPDGIRWRIRNLHGDSITLQFYNPSNHAHWPAGDRAYLLTPNVAYSVMRLRCIPGSQVCYGGNAPGRYWGTGLGLRHSCTGCCRTCGANESSVTLR